jgi:hypothetical protein
MSATRVGLLRSLLVFSTLLALMLVAYRPGSPAVRPALALGPCPSGWTAVTDADVPSLTTFCRKTQMTFPVYFIQVPSPAVGQYTELQGSPCSFGAAGDQNNSSPAFFKRLADNWLSTWRGCGINIGIVINGTFFGDTDISHPTSQISYPLYNGGVGVVTAGFDPNPANSRVCFGFGGAGSSPTPGVWNLNNVNWFSTQLEFDTTPPNGCNIPTYHRIVGVSPSYKIGSLYPRTYMGSSNSSPGDVCILVGGLMSNKTANDTMTAFGCTSRVQLDGGSSSQMAYWNGASVVFGASSTRTVPHAIVIFR